MAQNEVRPTVSTRTALVSGAVAGAAVDTSLYPIDTVKTRLQSEAGFWKSGGFRGIYRGLSSAIIGSAPGAALFFAGYEGGQRVLKKSGFGEEPIMYAIASTVGEVVKHCSVACSECGVCQMACVVRVPTENIKQNMQMAKFGQPGAPGSLRATVTGLIEQRGFAGMWRGYSTTVMREVCAQHHSDVVLNGVSVADSVFVHSVPNF
jgi:solute carrier family 25 S-adenosylmethionine transporter 26